MRKERADLQAELDGERAARAATESSARQRITELEDLLASAEARAEEERSRAAEVKRLWGDVVEGLKAENAALLSARAQARSAAMHADSALGSFTVQRRLSLSGATAGGNAAGESSLDGINGAASALGPAATAAAVIDTLVGLRMDDITSRIADITRKAAQEAAQSPPGINSLSSPVATVASPAGKSPSSSSSSSNNNAMIAAELQQEPQHNVAQAAPVAVAAARRRPPPAPPAASSTSDSAAAGLVRAPSFTLSQQQQYARGAAAVAPDAAFRHPSSDLYSSTATSSSYFNSKYGVASSVPPLGLSSLGVGGGSRISPVRPTLSTRCITYTGSTAVGGVSSSNGTSSSGGIGNGVSSSSSSSSSGEAIDEEDVLPRLDVGNWSSGVGSISLSELNAINESAARYPISHRHHPHQHPQHNSATNAAAASAAVAAALGSSYLSSSSIGQEVHAASSAAALSSSSALHQPRSLPSGPAPFNSSAGNRRYSLEDALAGKNYSSPLGLGAGAANVQPSAGGRRPSITGASAYASTYSGGGDGFRPSSSSYALIPPPGSIGTIPPPRGTVVSQTLATIQATQQAMSSEVAATRLKLSEEMDSVAAKLASFSAARSNVPLPVNGVQS